MILLADNAIELIGLAAMVFVTLAKVAILLADAVLFFCEHTGIAIFGWHPVTISCFSREHRFWAWVVLLAMLAGDALAWLGLFVHFMY